jgi:hypothetical protein
MRWIFASLTTIFIFIYGGCATRQPAVTAGAHGKFTLTVLDKAETADFLQELRTDVVNDVRHKLRAKRKTDGFGRIRRIETRQEYLAYDAFHSSRERKAGHSLTFGIDLNVHELVPASQPSDASSCKFGFLLTCKWQVRGQRIEATQLDLVPGRSFFVTCPVVPPSPTWFKFFEESTFRNALETELNEECARAIRTFEQSRGLPPGSASLTDAWFGEDETFKCNVVLPSR